MTARERAAVYLAVSLALLIGVAEMRLLKDDLACHSAYTTSQTCVMQATTRYEP